MTPTCPPDRVCDWTVRQFHPWYQTDTAAWTIVGVLVLISGLISWLAYLRYMHGGTSTVTTVTPDDTTQRIR